MRRAMIQNEAGSLECYFPSRDDVKNLAVGDQAPDCFGGMGTVTDIFGSGVDVEGKLFACFYVRSWNGLVCSNSIKQDQVIRSVRLTGYFTSAQIDAAEASFRKISEQDQELRDAYQRKLDNQLAEALLNG